MITLDDTITEVIRYGNTDINFEIIFRKRKTLSIEVHPDTSVKVVAPLDASIESITKRVYKKASWILKSRNFFKPFQPLPSKKEYVSGETFYYLGRQYRLKVIKEATENVKLKGRFLWVYTSDKNNTEKIKKLVTNWFRKHAQNKFEERLDIVSVRFKKYGITIPTLQVKQMSKRWGSYVSGKIILNTKLVEAPIHCVDYVIVHELCHIRHPNHGKEFYHFLDKLMPDWKDRKKRLERNY